MKLAILGTVVLALGLALSVTGLILAGGLWVALGLLLHLHVRSLRERSGASSVRDVRATDTASFIRGSLILLAVGLPSLAIGIFEVGFDEPDQNWRWIPIAVGGLDVGIVVISSLMYAAGSGLEATADRIGVPEHPATITIRSMRETGTYINERPRIEFELTVEPEGMPAYELTKKATVPHTALGSLRVGDGFRAKVAPGKPKSIEIDWDSPIRGDGADGAEPSERLERLESLRHQGAITAEEHDRQRRRIIDGI